MLDVGLTVEGNVIGDVLGLVDGFAAVVGLLLGVDDVGVGVRGDILGLADGRAVPGSTTVGMFVGRCEDGASVGF